MLAPRFRIFLKFIIRDCGEFDPPLGGLGVSQIRNLLVAYIADRVVVLRRSVEQLSMDICWRGANERFSGNAIYVRQERTLVDVRNFRVLESTNLEPNSNNAP